MPLPTSPRMLLVLAGAGVVLAALALAFLTAEPESGHPSDTGFQDIEWIEELNEGNQIGFEVSDGQTLDQPLPTEAAPEPGPWDDALETRPLEDPVVATRSDTPSSIPPAPGPDAASPPSSPESVEPESPSAPPPARAIAVADEPSLPPVPAAAIPRAEEVPEGPDTPPASPSATVAAARIPRAEPAEDAEDVRPPISDVVLLEPRQATPGVAARTQGLITTRQFIESLPSEAARNLRINLDRPFDPVAQVSRDQAEAYAQVLTQDYQQQGLINRNQRFRLPTREETTTDQIWRREDRPAGPGEARPFGLVLEELPLRATEDGIPLRNDIPEGESPLEKQGADRPLWQRPQD